MAKLFISLAFVLALAAAVLGFMAKSKITDLQGNLKGTKSALRMEQDKLQVANNDLKKTGDELATSNDKVTTLTTSLDTKAKELTTTSGQLADAQNQVQAEKAEVAKLTKQVEDGKAVAIELEKAKADIAMFVEKQQKSELEASELRKLTEVLTKRVEVTEGQPKIDLVKRGPDPMSLQGKILAFNPGWNFVVLSVGDKQGVSVNAPLLVVRGGTPVARLRVTSVERTTSVADVIPGSAARGVTVQPGDMVILEGRGPATEHARPAPETAPVNASS